MKWSVFPLSLCLIFLSCSEGSPDRSSSASAPKSDHQEQKAPVHQQALIVITEGWEDLQATLYAVEWNGGSWQTKSSHAVVVGSNGLGWGLGVKDFTEKSGPVKHEGDKKSPAGVFTLGKAFGVFSPENLPKLGLPYELVEWETLCIEDTSSHYYNSIVREDLPGKDWEQNDRMTRKDDLYSLGAFVNHNTNPAKPGSGSCIFLHLWRDQDHGTLGCTAMPKSMLLAHLQWLDLTKNPVLVQVPRGEYASLATEFGLPTRLSATD
ncbi:MAG: hypothetical protein NWR72_14235 [Bacteroidia bacterium]|nr:hypothetical protein [Bacteroidia bacterium]